MFEGRARMWDKWLMSGVMCPLFKKGNRRMKGNYRGVVLLAMGSRVLARVCAKRMRWWSEHMNLMHENQWRFREGRSTADVTQVIVKMKEDDYVKRVGRMGVDAERTIGWLQDCLIWRKRTLRVSKPALWIMLERNGLKGRMLETLVDLHETTEYKVRGREGFEFCMGVCEGVEKGLIYLPYPV